MTPSLTSPQLAASTLHQFVRPLTRGELARRLKAGETCEVASHVEAITTVMLCHWLDCTNFTVEPSHNRGWHIYRPNPTLHRGEPTNQGENHGNQP